MPWLSFRSMNLPYALMQCTSAYPTPLEAVGLNVLDELRREFDCPVGLSDHSGSMFPGLAALARGANLLEVHVTFDRRMFGPDTAASLTFDELKIVCQMRDALREWTPIPLTRMLWLRSSWECARFSVRVSRRFARLLPGRC